MEKGEFTQLLKSEIQEAPTTASLKVPLTRRQCPWQPEGLISCECSSQAGYGYQRCEASAAWLHLQDSSFNQLRAQVGTTMASHAVLQPKQMIVAAPHSL